MRPLLHPTSLTVPLRGADDSLRAPTPDLPAAVAGALWRGDELGSAPARVCKSGFEALDAELPGGGWPCGAVTEILQPQYSVTELRLLLRALAPLASPNEPVLVVGPPHAPNVAGWRLYGLPEHHFVLVRVERPAHRLWATEQAVRANGLSAVIAWLPHARADQVRRLQAYACQGSAPVFLIRPDAAQHESSPAPLRIQVRLHDRECLAVHILKRRGPRHDGWLRLVSLPPVFARILPPQNFRAAHSRPPAVSRPQERDRAVLDRSATSAVSDLRPGAR